MLPTMNSLLTFSSAPTPSANWWPKLFLKKGNKLAEITPEQCGPVRQLFNAGRGFSEIRGEMWLHDETGQRIGHVSYNGRVWLHDVEGNIEIPVSGVKTVEQRNAEGWK